jgi:N-acetylglucosamine malate deacetylase 2
LVKYARLGHNVYVVIATDGKGGTRVTNISSGDSLGSLRKLESVCACEKMGIIPPIFLSIDRLDTKNGIRNYLNGYARLLELLKEKITILQPDIILTYDPDGDSHHSEHIVVGSAVTELILREGWVDKHPLYYLAAEFAPDMGYDLGGVNSQYLNIRIEYSDEDEIKTLAADACFVTQFTPEEKKKDYEEKTKDKNNFKFYRRFAVYKGLKNEF